MLSARPKESGLLCVSGKIDARCRMKNGIIGDSLVAALVGSRAWLQLKRTFSAIKVCMLQMCGEW